MGRIALTVGLAMVATACTFGSADNKRGSTPEPGANEDGTTGVADTGSALTGLPLDTGGGDDETTSALTATATGTDSGSTGAPGTTTGDATSTGGSESSSDSTGPQPYVLCDESEPDLRACYDFADIDKGTVTDRSMYGNDGTANGITVEAGPFGNAVRVSDGSEITIPDSDSLDLPGPLSFEAWAYVEGLPSSDRVGIVDNDAQYSAMLYADEGIRCHAGFAQASSPAFPMNTWFHVACVHDGDGMEIWIDGELVASAEGAGPVSTASNTPIAIGDSSPNYDVPLDGLVGGVRIWSTIRTAEEIEAAAGAGS